jgi:hypothetical protein
LSASFWAGAVVFFLGMGTMAPKSNNPVELMTTVGEVSGAVGAIGLVMIALGLIGRRKSAETATSQPSAKSRRMR